MQTLITKLAFIISIPFFAYYIAHDELVRALGTSLAIFLAAGLSVAVLFAAYERRRVKPADDISLRKIIITTVLSWALLTFANLFYFG